MNVTIRKAISIIPDFIAYHPMFLCIDDTIVPKSSKKFELVSCLYDLAPERTGKAGRPRKHGERLSLDTGFVLSSEKIDGYFIGVRRVWVATSLLCREATQSLRDCHD